MKTYVNASPELLNRLTARPSLDSEFLDDKIRAIFDMVQHNGDQALLEYTKLFDNVELDSLVADRTAMRSRARTVPQQLRRSINQASKNIAKFHSSQVKKAKKVETIPGVVCWQDTRPIDKVGLYIPGGSAPLISTVLMLAIPAQLAGCNEVVLCTPPDKNGKANPAICYAALQCGISSISLVGGGQAIAAMTIGTESVPRVDKIFGPGNQYVTTAKVFAQKYGVSIDMQAGPSEVMVIADTNANPEFIAADLLSQAEHGPDSQAVLLTNDSSVAKAVNESLAVQLEILTRQDIATKALAKSFCIIFESLDLAFEFANSYAPEHLILNIESPMRWLDKVSNAGSVFLGEYSPESAGDYASGTNHTLPTGGWARSFGGISIDSFVKQVSFQALTESGLKALAPTIEAIAYAEGLDAHARAVSIRLDAK